MLLFKSNVDVQFTVNSSQVTPEIWNYIDQSLSRDADWNLVSCVEEITLEGDRSFSTYAVTFQPPETALVGDMVTEIALLESMGAEFEGLLLSVPPSQGEPPRDALAEQSCEEQIRELISRDWIELPYFK